VELPYIPDDLVDRIDKLSDIDSKYGEFARLIIKTLQTHEDKSKKREFKDIETAAVVGVEIFEAATKEFQAKNDLMSRYKTLMGALMFSNPALREILIKREIEAD
jgi:hypothetical protein